jgi:hypothetical protein
MADFKVEGIEEFQEKLRLVERRAPDRILDKLDEEGKKLRVATRNNTPKVTGKLRKSYRLTEVEKIQGGYQKGLYNKAPHFHLVEKGHRKVSPSGEELGWTDGLFMVEKTVKQEEEPMMEELQNWLDELFKELS